MFGLTWISAEGRYLSLVSLGRVLRAAGAVGLSHFYSPDNVQYICKHLGQDVKFSETCYIFTALSAQYFFQVAVQCTRTVTTIYPQHTETRNSMTSRQDLNYSMYSVCSVLYIQRTVHSSVQSPNF